MTNATIGLGTGIGTGNSLTTGIIQTRTSGGAAGGTPNSSQSRATVNNLNLTLLGDGSINSSLIAVTADTVQSTTMCTCGANGPTCSGTTTIENLRVNGVVVANVLVMPAPNTVITVPLFTIPGFQTVTVTLTLNEQIFHGPGDITVNALRIQVNAFDIGVTTNIIVAQSRSDITCVAPTPTPTPVASPTPTPTPTPTPMPTPQTCTPTTTLTDDPALPSGIASLGVSSGPGRVTIDDHVNAGTGTQSITVVGVPINAVVNIPPFVPGTFNPVNVTFTPINPALPVDFTLRAASTFHAVFIRARCGTATTNQAEPDDGKPQEQVGLQNDIPASEDLDGADKTEDFATANIFTD